MNLRNYAKSWKIALAVISAGLLIGLPVQAQFLLTVNIFNPNSIVITATGLDAATAKTIMESQGIDLLNFFSADPTPTVSNGTTTLAITSSTLTAAGASQPYTSVAPDHESTNGTGAYFDLNIWSSGFNNQTFTTTSSAFSGSLVLTVTGTALSFATVGSTGTIDAGYSGTPGVGSIGTYQVISAAPEPRTMVGLGIGLALLFLLARRRNGLDAK